MTLITFIETLFIASLLVFQVPTARLVEEEGVLIESRLMRTCSWSALHPIWCFARRADLVQHMIKFGIFLLSINDSSRHQVIVHGILLGVEHDERYDPLVQNSI